MTAIDAFDPAVVEEARLTTRGSVERLVDMTIDDFVEVTEPYWEDDKAEAVARLREGGVKFNSFPRLWISTDGQSSGMGARACVTGFDGRHRTRQLKSEGYKTMPVLIEADFHWSEQNKATPGRDVRHRGIWVGRLGGVPADLDTHNGRYTVPFPVTREQAPLDYSPMR